MPTTLDDAINAVARLNSRREAYDRLGRNEKPLEVTDVHDNAICSSLYYQVDKSSKLSNWKYLLELEINRVRSTTRGAALTDSVIDLRERPTSRW